MVQKAALSDALVEMFGRRWKPSAQHSAAQDIVTQETTAHAELDFYLPFGKLPFANGSITPEFVTRCFGAVSLSLKRRREGRLQLFIPSGHPRKIQEGDTISYTKPEGELGADCIIDIFKLLGEPWWRVQTLDKYVEEAKKTGQLPRYRIIPEIEASHTVENAGKDAGICRSIIETAATLRNTKPQIVLAEARPFSSNYHRSRSRNRGQFLPEECEKKAWGDVLPYLSFNMIGTPYLPLTTSNPVRLVIAKIYCTGHIYPDLLVTNLHKVKDGTLTKIRPISLAYFQEGLWRLETLYSELGRLTRNQQTSKQAEQIRHNLHDALPKLRLIAQQLAPLAGKELNEQERDGCIQLTPTLSREVNEQVRWPADLDAQVF